MKMPLGWLWQNDQRAQRLRKDGAPLIAPVNARRALTRTARSRGAVGTRHGSAQRRERERGCALRPQLIRQSVNPLVATNPQGKITDVNAAAEVATGIPASS